MNRERRIQLLRERYQSVNPLARLAVTRPPTMRPTRQPNPNKVYMPWPEIIVDHTRRAPQWFMEEEKREPEPAVRTQRRTGDNPLTRIAQVLNDPEQLAAICLDGRRDAGNSVA